MLFLIVEKFVSVPPNHRSTTYGISARMAQLLEGALGMGAEFWMNAQAAYDLTTHRLPKRQLPRPIRQLA